MIHIGSLDGFELSEDGVGAGSDRVILGAESEILSGVCGFPILPNETRCFSRRSCVKAVGVERCDEVCDKLRFRFEGRATLSSGEIVDRESSCTISSSQLSMLEEKLVGAVLGVWIE